MPTFTGNTNNTKTTLHRTFSTKSAICLGFGGLLDFKSAMKATILFVKIDKLD